MSDARIIEVEGEAAGIVVGDNRGFQFFAASSAFYALEGVRFHTPNEAQKAITRLALARRSDKLPRRD
jgi:hypothetical protein